MTNQPLASVVIPAHDEASVIERCLRALCTGPHARLLEVAVVANGCTDDTAGIARRLRTSIPHLTVVELGEASKAAALNAGDGAVVAFPRIYLDADIVLDDEAVAGLVTTLTTPRAVVSSPHVLFDVRHASWSVRQFYRAYAATPYLREGVVGLGVYGVSEAGRRRFGTFPELTADDLFVQRLFRPDERVTCAGTFTVSTPRTVQALVRVRTRTASGSAQLAASNIGSGADTSRTTASTMHALLDEARREPRRASAVAVYAAVTLAARVNARRVPRTAWLRDDSSRATGSTGQPRSRGNR